MPQEAHDRVEQIGELLLCSGSREAPLSLSCSPPWLSAGGAASSSASSAAWRASPEMGSAAVVQKGASLHRNCSWVAPTCCVVALLCVLRNVRVWLELTYRLQPAASTHVHRRAHTSQLDPHQGQGQGQGQ